MHWYVQLMTSHPLTPAQVLKNLARLLGHQKESIQKEACWTISNITAGNPSQVELVIEANIIPGLVEILKNGDFKARKEAAWAISNATSGGNDDQLMCALSMGASR